LGGGVEISLLDFCGRDDTFAVAVAVGSWTYIHGT
jgi:hypothetical protein